MAEVNERFAEVQVIPSSYRGTMLMRNSAPLGTYSRTMPGALWWS